MRGKLKITVVILLAIVASGILIFFAKNNPIGSLHPRGVIAIQERNTILFTIGVMLVIVIPTLIILYGVARKYRADNPKANHRQGAQHGFFGEVIMWVFPLVIVLILIVPTWNAAHQVDPMKPLDSSAKPLTIQVVALNWKWLFIYPEQNIATVNFVEFPAGTPVDFKLTADAPMNSFWIPQLGGQMMAMAGMSTQLHLIANAPGEFSGTDVEINGGGFARMKFIAKVTSQSDFDAWAASVKESSPALTLDTYNTLTKDSMNNLQAFYGSTEKDLYHSIIMKYLMPASPTGMPSSTTTMPAMPQPSPGYGGQAGMQM